MIEEGFRSVLSLSMQGEADEETRTISSSYRPQSSAGALRAHYCSNLSVSLRHCPGTCSLVLPGDLHRDQSVAGWFRRKYHDPEYQFFGLDKLDLDICLPGQRPSGHAGVERHL